MGPENPIEGGTQSPKEGSTAADRLKAITDEMRAKREAREAEIKNEEAPQESASDKVAVSKARVDAFAAQTEENLRKAGFIKTAKPEGVDEKTPDENSPEHSG